ncbi:MAG TPA: ArsB/NhaD family transporter [Candidatus Limnocylindrales bacterium]|nr:ArsB/NhaD family transporter [Candidatus Limnocylindrales bacterium]
MDALLAGLIFAAVYALIATERLDKTLAALLGGTVVVLLGIVSQESAFEAIDLNVIFLLAGMMILAGILRRTGFFQWLAIRSVRIAAGEPYRLLIVLSVVSALISAFLDNVTTVVLLAPVTLYIAGVLRVSPVPFLISEILASNIGGTATLIGDPPNILIGSAAGLGFVEFLLNLGPVAVLILIAFLFATRFLFKGDLEVQGDVRAGVLALDAREVLTDIPLLRWSLGVIGLTILGFVFAVPLGLETGTIALFGATLLTVISRVDVATVLEEIEWPTLFFFIGLFMLVSAIVEVGIIDALAEFLIDLTGGDATVTSIGLLWLSAIASAIVDNIPYTTTMIPVVERLGASGIPIEPLWWALALGACLGGNATIVGASANVVGANLAGRAGHPIGFATFFRYGFLVALLSIVIATAYLYVRYLW